MTFHAVVLKPRPKCGRVITDDHIIIAVQSLYSPYWHIQVLQYADTWNFFDLVYFPFSLPLACSLFLSRSPIHSSSPYHSLICVGNHAAWTSPKVLVQLGLCLGNRLYSSCFVSFRDPATLVKLPTHRTRPPARRVETPRHPWAFIPVFWPIKYRISSNDPDSSSHRESRGVTSSAVLRFHHHISLDIRTCLVAVVADGLHI